VPLRRLRIVGGVGIVFGYSRDEPSGSGKSSLVKAGLLPDLRLPGMIGRVGLVRWATMRPSDRGGALLATLAMAILEQPTALPELMASPWQESVETLVALLREAPGQAARPIRQGLAAAAQKAELTETAEARLLLVIDQFEELFTLDGLSPAERVSFVAVLSALAQSGLVWVVATMRSDFFDRLEALPALAALSSEGRYLLLAPSLAELGQIIRGPAQEAGLRFEVDAARGVGLDEVIRQAIEQAEGALPLLSFLLDQLWLRRSEHGLLTFAAYNALGGLEGAIGRRAEEVFQAQPAAAQAELVQLMRELVSVEDGKPFARAAPLARFPEGSPLKALAEAFLDPAARLLIADAASGEPQLRLAHVALLSHWPRARDQVVADARDLELRGRLQREAEQWRNAPRREKHGRLRPAGIALAEASTLLSRWGTTLPAEICDFIAASRRAAIRRVVRLWVLVTGAPIAIALLALAVWAGRVWWGVHAVEVEMQFVPIPAGCFMMGSLDTETERSPNEGPVHEVCLKAFELGKFEVTQAEWRRVMVHNRDPSKYKGDRRPVETLSWNEAQTFIWLMNIFGHHHYQLPSEAQWEYAARAGTTTARYWGERAEDGCAYENMADVTLKKSKENSEADAVFADCDDHQLHTAPVGSFKPNPWGLNDMLGNVAEWVDDCYVGDYGEGPRDHSLASTQDCSSRIVRGGSFWSSPREARAAHRDGSVTSGTRTDDVGFRLARTVGP
jgi:formylglycine-generating enzyme required for sulfatase activity